MDKQEKVPMYQVIVDDIKRQVSQGQLRPHDLLPNQIDLARQYNTSEITSRRALTELVQANLIYRIRGKGSFVSELPVAGGEKQIQTVYFASAYMSVQLYNHRFFTDMLAGLKEICVERGISFYMWDMGPGEGRLPDDPNAGIVLLPNHYLDLNRLVELRNEARRLITIQSYYPHLNIPYVIVDNLTGGYLATQHLLSLGHKRIGIILTGSSIVDMNQEFSLRLQGYRLALSQYQLAFDPDLVWVRDDQDERVEAGYDGFKALMELPEPPTAVFATSDYKAFGVMTAARDMGFSIPDDISLVGYDDVVLSEYSYPNLTTINQNTHKLSRRAVEILLLGQQEPGGQVVKDEIVPNLIVRESTTAYHTD